MTAGVKNIYLAHERDAAWLIALWLAIHGGDPAPKEGEVVAQNLQEAAALNAIAALSEALDEKAKHAVLHALESVLPQKAMHSVEAKTADERLKALGIHILPQTGEHAQHRHTFPQEGGSTQHRLPYCFRFRGQVYCVQLPDVRPHPEA